MNGSLAMTVKALDAGADGPGEFEAIISTTMKDRDGETVKAGAFAPLPQSIPIFYSHDWRTGALPVGKAAPFYDGDVLKAKGTFASTPRGQEMRSLVNEEIVDSMSVGFFKAVRRGGVVSKGELFEASFTGIPINTGARVLATKAASLKSVMDGSYEDLAEDLKESLVETLPGVSWLYIRGTFADHVVYDVCSEDDMTTTTWSVDYTQTGDDTFTFGEPVEVDVEEVIVASESDKSVTAADPAATKAAAPAPAEVPAASPVDEDGHNQLLARSLERLAAL